MKTIPEKVLDGIVKQFYRRRNKGEVVARLIKEIAQVTYSQGYAQAKIDNDTTHKLVPLEPSDKSPHRESRNNFVLYKENGKTKLMEIIGESDDTKTNQ